MPKIEQLPGVKYNPRTLLHQVLETEVEAVAVVVFEKDGSIWTDWSNMKASDLAAGALCLTGDAQQALAGAFRYEPRNEDESG